MSLPRKAWQFVACGVLALTLQHSAAAAQQCTTEFRLPILLRTTASSATPPLKAFLVGNLTPSLRIVESASGRLLWTAGAAGATTQRFAAMTAGFSSSLAALDIDGDGAHDRIYAGDLHGRLWRFDIDARGLPSTWFAGGIFADLSGATGRGFLAAPDLTLIAPAGVKPWLSIALGTANTSQGQGLRPVPGDVSILNRFYVLRDRAPFERWTQLRYDRWRPLFEADLKLAEGTQTAASPDAAGYYINLGAQQVAAAALTIDGNTFYTTVSALSSLLPTCVAPTPPEATTVNVGSISAAGTLNALVLATPVIRGTAADSAITLVREETSDTGAFVCEVAGHALPGCSFDSTLKRSFWRREDAD